ncbi:EspA/EspE family type VII secretion system effector [Mycobacterium kansasii]|uniref:ESX-1 secretion-associated protein EspA n=3 Tax=Mycobacterium kansasii TaxID=1768 RepID=A0A653EN95_MYCKA|nr:EspA/EspE family type VII secretion system effector [Mycobacterium kansasii]AGZ50149.1 hypothetical protein MKAN_07550 [Mycobacterium kansasii ATCC 12478]EUA20091.1 putative eSX-1 secretion-associated protein EspE [Mycobacterium kansasii 662]MXO38428.1 hypothetical protein [Mycobacterium kansasii]POX72869.1 hypothetical protein C3475_13695 [Mycobacterium kansasii]POX77435.1 hypothetical protein C3470_22290 [Mycobacterium kansasii]
MNGPSVSSDISSEWSDIQRFLRSSLSSSDGAETLPPSWSFPPDDDATSTGSFQFPTDSEDELPNISDDNPEKRVLRGSVVCYVTWCALGGMLGWLGDGSPDAGDRLVASGSVFDDVSAQIAALIPDGGWQGLAAQAYVGQNLAQSQRAKMMGDLDRLAGGLVSAQAPAVSDTRRWLLYEMITVAAVGVGCLALEEFGGPAGQQASLAVAVVVCAAALGVAIDKMVSLKNTTSQNATNLQGLTQRLTAMATTSPTPSTPIPGLPDVPSSPTSSPTAGLPDDTGPRPETPDVGVVLADLPGSPGVDVPDLPSPGFPDFGARHLPIPTLTGMPNLPNALPGLPTVPTADEFAALPDLSGALAAVPGLSLANLPTMAQLATPLGQLSGLSGAASGLGQLATMAGQQAQMISALAQQSTQQHTTLTHQVTPDDDTPGADAGTANGQRAPIDTATSPSQPGQQRVP